MKIPKEVLDQHTIVLGKTRSGKSTTMRGMVEHLLDQSQPVCIIDPKGDWWGLKSSADGKRAGYPVVIFGGNHADVPINARSGAQVAELIATGNRPCIIDLGGWTVGDRTRFFIDFASSLFKHSRGQRWLAIDEVHNFCPKGKIMSPDAGMMLHWANRLASEGLGKGICLIAASQRPQKVHNDFLTSCETLIAMRAIHAADRNAMKEWIDGCADAEKGKEVLATLAGLKRGQGWVWSPEIEYGPKIVDFPKYATYDSFKMQKAEAEAKVTGWANVDLEEVKTKLAAVVEQAKQNDPAELRRQVSALNAALKEAGKIPSAAIDQSVVDQARAQGTAHGYREGLHDVMVELRPFLKSMDDMVEVGQRCSRELHGVMDKIELKAKNVIPPAAQPTRRQPITLGSLPADLDAKLSRGKAAQRFYDSLTPMDKAARAFLTVLAQQERALTRNQIAVFAGYSAKSGHVDNTLGGLRARGYVNGSRESIVITSEGVSALGPYEPLPTGAALREYWCNTLDTAASKFLAVLCRAYPETLTRNEIAELSGYSTESGHVDNTLSALRTRMLITGKRDAIKASEELF